MNAVSVSIAPGSLFSRIEEQTRVGEREGALLTIATTERIVEAEGVPFVVRCVDSLARKDRARRKQPARANPFLPTEPALTLGTAPTGHVAVLNKFNVLEHHLLLVTPAFRHQEELLAPADFLAFWWANGELPSLGFYNGGEAAGASQPHKHLQIAPLPLGSGSDLPVEARLRIDEGPSALTSSIVARSGTCHSGTPSFGCPSSTRSTVRRTATASISRCSGTWASTHRSRTAHGRAAPTTS